MQIREFEAAHASEEVLRGVYRVTSAVERENFPDDEAMPFEQARLRWTTVPSPHEVARRYYAVEDSETVGHLLTVRWPLDDPTNSFIVVEVLPDRRRRGFGTRLFLHAMDELQPNGVEKLIVDCVAGRPWEPTLDRWGLRNALTEKRNRLYFSDIDWDLMRSWIERSQERATDYEVIHLTTPVPDEYLERWCRINHVMNSAPEEDLELADFDMTPDKWRAEEKEFEAKGDMWLAAVALHRPTGEFAGYTDVFVQKYHVEQAFQHDTGVDTSHRNKGLGRWLKAEMVTWIARDFPAVNRIDTWNAGSNAPMLGINDEMGFKLTLRTHSWQGQIGAIREAMTGGAR